jgi:predicted dehydrogenase
MWLNGGIRDVSAVTETFIKERVHQESGKMQKVGIDDACIFHCHFDNGSLGVFEATRYARGHKALNTLEINGEHASLKWNLHDMNYLELFDHADDAVVRGWRRVLITDSDQPYMDKWWIPGTSIGYEHTFVHQVADFLKSLETGEPCEPTFQSAQETQKVCEAVIDSANSRSWKDTGVVWQ